MAAKPGEDEPIVVGGPHMITVQLPDRLHNPARNFSIAPKDPKVPFKEIVIMEGAKEVFRRPLTKEWTITIR
jgi:hypothetical protein